MKRLKDFRGPRQSEKPNVKPQQQGETVYHIPFTIPEIDRLMTDLIDLNIPIQTYMMLDQKFNAIKRAAGVHLNMDEVRTFQSKMNAMEGGKIIPDWEEGKKYLEGDTFVRRDPFGVFKVIKGKEIDITTNEGSDQSLANGPGEIN